MEINFECQKCGIIFDCDVGDVTVDENTFRPQFENEINCPTCGKRTIDEIFLTETGQSQLTHATLELDPGEIFHSDNDELFGLEEAGQCQGCDALKSLNDLGLCEDCAVKLDRDLIRQRDWKYSSLAFGVPSEKYEDLRHNVIAVYGEKFELIAPDNKRSRSSKKKQKRRKRIKGMPR
jgi:hypothetical protein